MIEDPIGDNEYLTSVATLAQLVSSGNVVLIDVREPEEYQAGHIPGAVSVYDVFTYLVTRDNGGYEAMVRYFAECFGAAGLDGNERVVVYEDAMDNGYGRSCRGSFLLCYMGHPKVTVLHGGYQAWLEAGLPLSTDLPVVIPKTFPVTLNPSIMVTADEMLAALDDPNIIKLDVRDHAEWVGTSSSPYGPEFTPRKGRIPGATWIEWYRFMRQDRSIPWFKSPEDILATLSEAGIHPDNTVYTYCFKGARTSNVFIALKLAGIRKVRNYFGSWNEWSRDLSLPIEKGYPKPRLIGR